MWLIGKSPRQAGAALFALIFLLVLTVLGVRMNCRLEPDGRNTVPDQA
jgi:Tfp pilus assembly protein PilX